MCEGSTVKEYFYTYRNFMNLALNSSMPHNTKGAEREKRSMIKDNFDDDRTTNYVTPYIVPFFNQILYHHC